MGIRRSGTNSLTVTKAGTGSGSVTSLPAGINCGATCSPSFASGTSVTLNATPAPGSTFAGWSGACSGTGGCSVTINAATAVTATFNASATTFALSVAKASTGSGTVTTSPTGLDCGTTCSASYRSGHRRHPDYYAYRQVLLSGLERRMIRHCIPVNAAAATVISGHLRISWIAMLDVIRCCR